MRRGILVKDLSHSNPSWKLQPSPGTGRVAGNRVVQESAAKR